MSRRIAFCVLAASAALIATPAIADRECFEQPCHQQEAAEPPASVAPLADADVSPALDASAAVEKLAPAKALPQVVATPQPAPKVTPQVATDPVARPISPPAQSLADESFTPREPARLAPRTVSETRAPERVITPAPSSYARTTRVSSPDPMYTASVQAPASAAVVVVVPGALAITGRYMIAPSAKIISIDSDD
jgi:hypothetical protein